MYNETHVFADTVKLTGSVTDITEYADPGLTDAVVLCKTPLTVKPVVDVGKVPELETNLKVNVEADPLIHNSIVLIT